MKSTYIGTKKAQRIQAVNQAAARAADPRMRDFWERTEKMIARNH